MAFIVTAVPIAKVPTSLCIVTLSGKRGLEWLIVSTSTTHERMLLSGNEITSGWDRLIRVDVADCSAAFPL